VSAQPQGFWTHDTACVQTRGSVHKVLRFTIVQKQQATHLTARSSS